MAGLGYWGPNLVRNFDELAELAWLVDLDPELRERFAARYPNARVTGELDEALDDESVDAVVVATPGPDPPCARETRARGRQACSGREAAVDAGRRDGRARLPGGRT